MNMMDKQRPFVAYEYLDVTVENRYISYYLDGYENFGWQCDENMTRQDLMGGVSLHFKRDRRIINRMELTRLQRQFESCMNEIKALEGSKSSQASTLSLITGLTGTAFMAGSVFAVTAQPPVIWLCILLALPGFAGWILALPVYKRILQKRTRKVDPLMEEKFEEIYTLFEKGHRLLQN